MPERTETIVATGTRDANLMESFKFLLTPDADTTNLEVAALQALSDAISVLEKLEDMPPQVALAVMQRGIIRFTAEIVVPDEEVS